MNTLFDFIKNPKDRQDFFIALIVIALFGFGIMYTIAPNNSLLASDVSLSEQELAQKMSNALAEGKLKTKIFTDLESSEDFSIPKETVIATVKKHQTSITTTTTVDTSTQTTKTIPPQPIEKNTTPTGELYDKNKEKNSIEEEKEVDKKEAIEKEEINANAAEKEAEIVEEVPEEIEKSAAENDETTSNETATKTEVTSSENKAEEKQEVTTNTTTEQPEATTTPKTDESAPANYDATKTEPTPPTSTTNKTATKPKTSPQKPKKTTPRKATKKGCVIVVGAFQYAEGVDLLLEQLRAANYRTTTGYIKGLRYVGVPVNCNNHARTMQNLNDKFNKEAWLLRDQ